MSAATPIDLNRNNLEAKIASGDSIDVRQFSVRDGFSMLFEVDLLVRSHNQDIDFSQVIGRPASFAIAQKTVGGQARAWSGVVNHIEQVGVEDTQNGLSTYQITLVPTLWLLTQRRNHRMFQLKSEPKIVLEILKEWGIEPELRIEVGSYTDRKYRVQYGESDYAFISRMLEDAGISMFFDYVEGQSKLILADAPETLAPRATPLNYLNEPSQRVPKDYVTDVVLTRLTRPGKYTQRDVDYRRAPNFALLATAEGQDAVETRLERFHYNPGSFLFRGGQGGGTPSADDKGKFRTLMDEAQAQVQKRLEAKQGATRMVVFRTNAFDLRPGIVMSMTDHPRADLAVSRKLLIVASSLDGDSTGDWVMSCEARYADMPYRPPLTTPKPRVQGIESATVVGPAGEEIHTDEFGRVRVHFHWDRESAMNDDSSCWIPVSQPWGGTGYGGMNIPRIGQEVIVDFLGGDPDRPVVVGRVYTDVQKVPYPLPLNKTQSGWKSNSSPSTGGFNELMFEDKAGEELVRFQAEKDYSGLVKNDSGHVIGHDSTSHVGNDQVHSVVRDETMKVGRDRKVRVQQDQAHVIDRHLIQQSVQGTTTHLSKDTMFHKSDRAIVLSVGTSVIIMDPNMITIQAELVHVNPGGVQVPPPPQPPVIDGVRQQDGHFFGAP